MNVSPNELRRETVAVLKQINDQIDELRRNAAGRGVPPEKLVDTNGGYLMSPLLLAKAQCLQTLTLLNEKR